MELNDAVNPFDGVPDGMFTVPNRAEERAYRRKRKRFTLRFEQHATLAGLEIRARSVSFGRALELQELADAFDGATDAGAAKEAAQRMVAEFVTVCESWNYRDDEDRLAPLTSEFLLEEFDPEETMSIMRAWLRATQGVTDPLPSSSAGGPPSAEAQIPMDIPSPSLAS